MNSIERDSLTYETKKVSVSTDRVFLFHGMERFSTILR